MNLFKNEEQTLFVHKSSYVDDGVTIGPGSKVWHFSHIQSGALIGKNTKPADRNCKYF